MSSQGHSSHASNSEDHQPVSKNRLKLLHFWKSPCQTRSRPLTTRRDPQCPTPGLAGSVLHGSDAVLCATSDLFPRSHGSPSTPQQTSPGANALLRDLPAPVSKSRSAPREIRGVCPPSASLVDKTSLPRRSANLSMDFVLDLCHCQLIAFVHDALLSTLLQ